MSRLLFAALILAGTASAQEIACPKHLDNARLLGGGMYEGGAREYELVGLYQPVRGGYYVQYSFGPSAVKWLVCAYEGRKGWWQRIDSRATDCRLKSRGKRQVSVKLTCK